MHNNYNFDIFSSNSDNAAPQAESAKPLGESEKEALRPTYQERGAKADEVFEHDTVEPEVVSEENEKIETFEKSKQNPNFKKLVNRSAAPILAVAIALSAFAGHAAYNNFNSEPKTVASTRSGENEETKGIYDGYGEKGMWLSENKGGMYDFACAKEVAEVCDNDECEMIKYTAGNQVESFADYLANLPEQLQPEGFKNLTILETENKLEKLSDEDYLNVKQKFDDIMDKAFTRRVTVDGKQNNAYMRLKERATSIDHKNIELAKSITDENNLEVTQFYWPGDNPNEEIGFMNVKMTPIRDKEENIIGFEGCEQVVSQKTGIYEGLIEIENISAQPGASSENHPDQPSETEKPEETTIKSKDAENLIRIDNQAHEDIANNSGTNEIHVTPNPGVSNNEITNKPSANSYQGTEATIVQNDSSKNATPIQNQVSPENNYSENRGGANSNEYAPVQDNNSAQSAADAAEIPVDQAPTGGTDLEDILGDLGIN